MMLNATIPVNSVNEYVNTILTFPNFKFARGESRNYQVQFLPSVWRPSKVKINKTPIAEGSSYTVGEFQLLRNFQSKVIRGEINDPYFSVFIQDVTAEINPSDESLWHWTAFAQHYGTKTRLADITSDSLAALFFACERNTDDNGFVHIFRDTYNIINSTSNLNLVTFGGSYFDVLEIMDDENDKNPRKPEGNITTILIPKFPNKRIEAQKGAFCFTRDLDIPAYWGGQLSLEIPAGSKVQILADLERGIDENDGGGAFFLGLGLTGAAIAVASAGYKKIGTSNWFVMISNKPDTVNN